MIRAFSAIGNVLKVLRDDRSGLAMIEFAYSLPLLSVMIMTGGELTNFTSVRMRISQVVIHVADNAARMGSGSLLSVKTISETQINDLFTGANLQGGKLNLLANGRMILSSLQDHDNGVPLKYGLKWARCRGAKNPTWAYSENSPSWGAIDGWGPTGSQVTAPSGGATMVVEIFYTYQPIISAKVAPKTTMTEIAAMTVRDNRDLTTIYNTEGATASSCSTFSST